MRYINLHFTYLLTLLLLFSSSSSNVPVAALQAEWKQHGSSRSRAEFSDDPVQLLSTHRSTCKYNCRTRHWDAVSCGCLWSFSGRVCCTNAAYVQFSVHLSWKVFHVVDIVHDHLFSLAIAKMFNCKIRTESLALCQFRIHKVISDKNSTLMARIMLNKRAKFRAKIFRSYQVITF